MGALEQALSPAVRVLERLEQCRNAVVLVLVLVLCFVKSVRVLVSVGE